MTETNRDRIAATLSRHQPVTTGMTYNSPDVCACGTKTLPVKGDEYPEIRRARAFAAHQADVLTVNEGV